MNNPFMDAARAYYAMERHRVDFDGNYLPVDETCALCEFNEYPHEH